VSTFNDLSDEEKAALKAEFEAEGTPRERLIELLTLLQEGSNEAKIGRPCPRCKNYPFYAPNDEALIEGHVYSRDGLAEIRITGYCEFCFDLVTAEPEEEEEDNWPDKAEWLNEQLRRGNPFP
jgi:hypothetical protein